MRIDSSQTNKASNGREKDNTSLLPLCRGPLIIYEKIMKKGQRVACMGEGGGLVQVLERNLIVPNAVADTRKVQQVYETATTSTNTVAALGQTWCSDNNTYNHDEEKKNWCATESVCVVGGGW